MRTLFAAVTLLVLTLTLGSIVIVASLLGVKNDEGSLYDRLAHWWVKGMVWSSGVELVVHGDAHGRDTRRVFVANHNSWLDVPIVASLVARFRFIAKAEIRRVPLFGEVFRVVGTVYLERANRKAAFESYRQAADQVQGGASVIVFPEGTRGQSYALRPFKKGPFVLAVSAQAPIVPTVIHGTIRALPKGGLWIAPSRVDVHFLEPVPTAGLTYDDRDALAKTVHDRMTALLRERYGVESPAWEPRRDGE